MAHSDKHKRPAITQETPSHENNDDYSDRKAKKALCCKEADRPVFAEDDGGALKIPEAPAPCTKVPSFNASSGFALRPIKWDYVDLRRTNDEIHSSIPLNPVVTLFLDTPPMQRLRGLKQLGTADFVYCNCNHSRFEHSIGVMHLAGKLCARLLRQQPSLSSATSSKDILCVQLAGLLHDIGHGPFSHCYEHFVKVDLPNHLRLHDTNADFYQQVQAHDDQEGWSLADWDHEDASLMMIDAILEHLGLAMDLDHLDEPLAQIGDGIDAQTLRAHDPARTGDAKDLVLTSRDLLFVKECVCGSPIAAYTELLGPGFHGRPNEHQDWLYDIVANRHSGLDVDKIDYFARDQRRALKESGEINKVLMESAVVAWAACTNPQSCHRCSRSQSQTTTSTRTSDALASAASAPSTKGEQMHLMICFPKKLLAESVEFFRTRFSLHSKIYKHKTIEGMALMLSDIFCLAVSLVVLCPVGGL
jgi:deoxynucleoside triphosphate triphosphohydrolase SAMHD1